MSDPLSDLLATIDHLEADTDDEPDPFPWVDAARWTPGAVSVELEGDPYDTLPLVCDGAVIVCDPMRPWVVRDYQPPWWARE